MTLVGRSKVTHDMRFRLTLNDAEGEHEADIEVTHVSSECEEGTCEFWVECEMPEYIAGQRVARLQFCRVTRERVLIQRRARPALSFQLGDVEDTFRELARLAEYR